jgi:hypothetical protein
MAEIMPESQMAGKVPEAPLWAGGIFKGSDAFERTLAIFASGAKRAS